MEKQRDFSFDALRGIAIIAVVVIHATSLSLDSVEVKSGNYFFLIAFRQLFYFAVPAFFFISGYWNANYTIASVEHYKIFLIKRLNRILIPYLTWSSLLILASSIHDQSFSISKAAFSLITGGASGPYYFIIALTQVYALTPIIKYLSKSFWGNTLIVLISFANLSLIYILQLHFNFSIDFRVYGLLFSTWIIFYSIGIILGSKERKNLRFSNKSIWILFGILLSLTLSTLESFYFLFNYPNVSFVSSAVKFSSFTYSFFIILGFMALRERVQVWSNLIVQLGEYSFGIYLIHMISMVKINYIMKYFTLVNSFQPIYQVVIVFLTILSCYGAIAITRKLLKRSFSSNVLGF
ncbi:MAG: acyltransferase [Coleofasciculus sp. S288]|nr:acyltransferase [Coleofasciculus sp. S288]